jgi:hypothetical protein
MKQNKEDINMQQRMFPAQENNPAIVEQQIKDVFYNALLNKVLDRGGDITRENIEQKVQQAIIETISDILELSKKSDGVRLPTGKVITLENCPERYQKLFSVLLQLKNQQPTYRALAIIAQQITSLDSFKEINPTNYLLEVYGLATPDIRHINYDENDVTTDLIRNTFYNEMVTQAILATDQKWLLLSVEDLEDQEAIIYWALPALTLLEAIQQSQQSNGIRLLDDKVVNHKNCPQGENFPELVQTLLTVKSKVKSLTPDELHVIKHKIACEKELPDHLNHIASNPDIKNIINTIKGMAIQISQRRVFCEMVGHVVRHCLEILKPEQVASPKI